MPTFIIGGEVDLMFTSRGAEGLWMMELGTLVRKFVLLLYSQFAILLFGGGVFAFHPGFSTSFVLSRSIREGDSLMSFGLPVGVSARLFRGVFRGAKDLHPHEGGIKGRPSFWLGFGSGSGLLGARLLCSQGLPHSASISLRLLVSLIFEEDFRHCCCCSYWRALLLVC